MLLRERRQEVILVLKTGLINQANGSAYIEMEGTKIACAVYGPRQSKTLAYTDRATVNCEVKFAPFSSTARRGHIRDAQERHLSTHLQSAILPCIRFDILSPKANIDIFLTVLETDGLAATLAGAITCASSALADANIECYGLLPSAAVVVRKDEFFLDPTESDEDATDQNGSAVILVAYNPTLDEVNHIWQTGKIDTEISIAGIEKCIDVCNLIAQIMSKSLLEGATINGS